MNNPVVQLVNEWDSFEQRHPGADLADFCRYYLKQNEVATPKPVSTDRNAILVRVMSRINSAFNSYMRCALSDTELEHLEGFPFLNTVKYLGESKKTEIINYNLTELSTGIDILNRLLKKGLITERQDPHDKRSRLIKITNEGEVVLNDCYEKVGIASKILFAGLSDIDKDFCIQLLMPVEEKHTKIAIECKGKCLQELNQLANRNNDKTKKAL